MSSYTSLGAKAKGLTIIYDSEKNSHSPCPARLLLLARDSGHGDFLPDPQHIAIPCCSFPRSPSLLLIGWDELVDYVYKVVFHFSYSAPHSVLNQEN